MNKASAPATSQLNSSQAEKEKINQKTRQQKPQNPERNQSPRGFYNGDKNQPRKNIGSCTDEVAEERKIFGPWRAPDPERQKKLVNRLAPHKTPFPPDPRFDTWVNHFEYYWNIGIDTKSSTKVGTRKLQELSACNKQRDSNEGQTSFSESSSGEAEQKRLYLTQYHRQLFKCPKSSSGQLGESTQGNRKEKSTNSRSSRSDGQWTSRDNEAQIAFPKVKGASEDINRQVVPGLDRRYMGLQSVGPEELEMIIQRLTRMTSAYDAKFAPNPHVWVDKSPGAHMVIKKHNALA